MMNIRRQKSSNMSRDTLGSMIMCDLFKSLEFVNVEN
jgi:hypothetical protein